MANRRTIPAEKWDLNASTGNYILRTGKNERVIRDGSGSGCLYRSEFWGDHSFKYPVKGPWRTTLVAARRDLKNLRRK